MLINKLKRADLKVKIFEVILAEIPEIYLCIPKKLKPIINTRKLHQVVWDQHSSYINWLEIINMYTVCNESDMCSFSIETKCMEFPGEW